MNLLSINKTYNLKAVDDLIIIKTYLPVDYCYR